MKIDWDSLKWRHHDGGMLQAYLSENERIHIWSKQLQTVGPWDGPIHSHRCTLESEVWLGEIFQQRVSVALRPGPFTVWEVENASAGTKMVEVGSAIASVGKRIHMRQGDIYGMARGEFHLAALASDNVAVTYVRMGEKRGWASILTTGNEPLSRVHTELPAVSYALIAAARAGLS